MTFVARMIIDGCPVLLGDALISGPGKNAGVFPTTVCYAATEEQIAQGSVPLSLKRKLGLIHGRMAYGWAGRLQVVHEVLNEYLFRVDPSDICHKTFAGYVEGLSEATSKEISLATIFYNSDGSYDLGSFGSDCVELPAGEFGKILLLGTGKRAFDEFRSIYNYRPMPWVPSELPQDLMNILGKCGNMMGSLLSNEMLEHTTLHDNFGGAYETIFGYKGRLNRMDDIMHYFWSAIVPEEGRLQIQDRPQVGIHCDYEGETLVVRTYRGVVPDDPRERMLAATPAHLRDLTPEEFLAIPVPAFEGSFHHHHVTVTFNKPGYRMFWYGTYGDRVGVEFDSSKNYFNQAPMELTKYFWADIRSKIFGPRSDRSGRSGIQ